MHVQYSYDDHSIYVVNSKYEDFKELKVTAKIFNFDLNEKYSKSAVVGVGPNGKTEAFKISFPAGLSKIFFLKLKLEDDSGKEITANFYWLSTVKDVQGTRVDPKIPPGVEGELFVAKPN